MRALQSTTRKNLIYLSPLVDGLIVETDFANGTYTNLVTESLMTNSGTTLDTTTPGQEFALFGTESYIETGVNITSSYTKYARVRFTANTAQNIISNGATGDHVFWRPQARIEAGHTGPNYETVFSADVSNGVDYEVCLTFDGVTNTFSLYVDKVLVDQEVGDPTNISTIRLGKYANIGGTGLNGRLYKAMVWNRVLSEEEQASIDYTQTYSPSSPPAPQVGVSKKPDIAGVSGVGGYVEYLPQGYDNSGATKYTTVVWLHGLGEAGDGSSGDLDSIFNGAIMNWLKTNDKDAIVLAPQSNSGYFDGSPNRAEEFFDYCFNGTDGVYKDVVDTSNIHVIGYSAGAFSISAFIANNGTQYQNVKTLTVVACNSFSPANSFTQRILDNSQTIWFLQSDTGDGTDGVVSATAASFFFKTLYDLTGGPDACRWTTFNTQNHTQMQDVVYQDTGNGLPQETGLFDTSYPYYEWTSGSWWDWIEAPTGN